LEGKWIQLLDEGAKKGEEEERKGNDLNSNVCQYSTMPWQITDNQLSSSSAT